MRISLIQPPYYHLARPSYGLELLAAVLRRAGHSVRLEYSNLSFAVLLGLETYSTIAEFQPAVALVSDATFRSSLCGGVTDARVVASILEKSGDADHNTAEALGELVASASLVAERFNDVEADRVLATAPDVIGITTIFYLAPALAFARALRRHGYAGVIILGGSHCEGIMGEAILQAAPFVDCVLRGESEETLPALVELLEAGSSDFSSVSGLVWRQGIEQITNREDAEATNLDSLPFVEYDEWLAFRQSVGLGTADCMLTIETSRGCWYGMHNHCTFCGLNGQTIGYRSKSPERALMEFDALSRYSIRNVYATDNILSKEYYSNVLQGLADRGAPFDLFYEVRSGLTEREMDSLSRAGVAAVQPGIESLSTHVLRLMKKGIESYQNIRTLVYGMKFGISIGWNLIYGFPGETADDYRQITKLISLLGHLEAPGGGGPVRADRFSPLFDNSVEHGITNLRPRRMFDYIFGPLCDSAEVATSDLSYYFDHDYVEPNRPTTEIEGMFRAMAAWRKSFGTQCLASATINDATRVLDTRVGHAAFETLDPDSARILEIALRGIGKAVIDKTLASIGLEKGVGHQLLQTLLRNEWVLDIDNKYISIVVPIDQFVPRLAPESLVRSIMEVAYLRLASQVDSRRPVPGYLPESNEGLVPVHSLGPCQ